MDRELTSGERNIVDNLRERFLKYIPESMTSRELLNLYSEFSGSLDFGNNDELFPQWLSEVA